MEKNKSRHHTSSHKFLYLVPVILLMCAVMFFTIAVSGYIETFGVFYAMLVRDSVPTPVIRDLEGTFVPYTPTPENPAVTAQVLSSKDLPTYPMDGEMIGTLNIASIGLDCNIYQGDSDAMLKKGVGHSFFSMLPGEGNNIVLSAHRNTFFKRLGDINVGDTITITTAYGEYVYKMEESVIFYPADGQEIVSNKSEETLTLYTCYPFIYRGHAPQRYAVICSLVSGTSADWGAK